MKMRLTLFTYDRDLSTISYLLDECSDVTLDAPTPLSKSPASKSYLFRASPPLPNFKAITPSLSLLQGYINGIPNVSNGVEFCQA